jgi:hypothetical protein
MLKNDFLVDNLHLHATLGPRHKTYATLCEIIYLAKLQSGGVSELRGRVAMAAILISLGWPI